MKKKLNTGVVINELAGASLFFTRPSQDTSKPLAQTSAPIPQETQAKPVNQPKSGLADSPFFTSPEKVQINSSVDTPLPEPQPVQKSDIAIPEKKNIKKNKKALKKETIPVPFSSGIQKSNVPQTQEEIFELVGKAAKEIGKEAATHRFTVAEKRHIAEIVYTYKTQGIKTTENEITRIAVNFLIEDYKANGENSILDRILKAINA